ncbi:MAG TPA: hypothetical protein PKY30_13115 [Myxococcota bacterium]|nr:hypothetical protein [Myxococcota bacterium]
MWWIFDCSPQRGLQPAEAEVSYAGYVYATPDTEGELFTAGTMEFQLANDEPVEGEQPYPEDYPGYWWAPLPASQSFELRITGEGVYPTRWAGRAPASDGGWFAGTLFAGEKAWMDDLFAQVAPDAGKLSEGAIHLWGLPYDPEAWDCAKVQVQGRPVRCFDYDAETATFVPVETGPFDWFFAVDLNPGEVEVDSGIGGKHVYTAEAGDLVMALWFQGEVP